MVAFWFPVMWPTQFEDRTMTIFQIAPSRLHLAAAVCLATTAASAGPLPARDGACAATRVKEVGYRLEGMPDSGSAISYRNGGYQVSYDRIPAMAASRPGDPVRLCLVSVPRHCPRGDARGRVYRATNLRTGRTWTAPNAEHSCGGA
jgi:hypothetical protein